MLGTIETNRSTRRMRSARSTEKAVDAGNSEMATITKSKTFHGSRQYRQPSAASRSAISTTNSATASRSRTNSGTPTSAVTAGTSRAPA